MENYVKILNEEHQNILKFIDVIKKEINRLTKTEKINQDFWYQVIDFIKNYADRLHHAKEEDLLFKEMCQDHVALHCNPIEQMLYEHNLGRDYVKGIKEGLENNDKQKIIDNANNYCLLLTEHIFKEDNILYPMAEQVLSQSVKDLLTEQFTKVEKEKFGADEINKYLIIIKENTDD